MPRTKLEPERALEYLSVLDERGKLDREHMPAIDDDLLRRIYETMLLARRFDERLLTLQSQGRIGTFAPVRGQEASQLGAMAALRESDWFVPAFREFAAMLWRGFPLEDIIVQIAGYNEGGAIAEGRHDLPIAIPVASQIPHAVGLAYASRQRDADEVAIAFFGDGATSEGDFHEALNLAGVWQVPCIFVCQNNHWAISMPRARQSRVRTLAQKGLAYGIPALQVDGNDVLAVYAAVSEAAQRARAGDGPTFIECVTYRLSVHTTADDPSKYRSEDELDEWQQRDPLPRLQSYLGRKRVVGKQRVSELESQIESAIDDAWQNAESRMQELSDPRVIFDHHYAEMPPYLEWQRQRFAAHRDHEG